LVLRTLKAKLSKLMPPDLSGCTPERLPSRGRNQATSI